MGGQLVGLTLIFHHVEVYVHSVDLPLQPLEKDGVQVLEKDDNLISVEIGHNAPEADAHQVRMLTKDKEVRGGSRSFCDSLLEQIILFTPVSVSWLHRDSFGDETNQIGEYGEWNQPPHRLVIPLSAPVVPKQRFAYSRRRCCAAPMTNALVATCVVRVVLE